MAKIAAAALFAAAELQPSKRPNHQTGPHASVTEGARLNATSETASPSTSTQCISQHRKKFGVDQRH